MILPKRNIFRIKFLPLNYPAELVIIWFALLGFHRRVVHDFVLSSLTCCAGFEGLNTASCLPFIELQILMVLSLLLDAKRCPQEPKSIGGEASVSPAERGLKFIQKPCKQIHAHSSLYHKWNLWDSSRKLCSNVNYLCQHAT